MFFYFKYSLFILALFYMTNGDAQNKDNGAISISLKSYNESQYTAQVFSTKTLLHPGETKEIIVSNVDRLIKYFIVQVHSFEINTLLSNTTSFTPKTTVNGTNNGLVQRTGDLLGYKFYVRNKNHKNVTILALVVAYPDNVPIPGGCNMEFMVETAPYQKLHYTKDIVQVDAQSASLEGETCDNYVLSYSMYHLYLNELDFSEENYFSAVQKMITPEDIKKYGTKVHKSVPNKELRRIYSAYHGTGVIYGIIVSFVDDHAAYVPISTYACDPMDSSQGCDTSMLPFSKFVCGAVIILGLFTCLIGHHLFKTTILFIGILIGTFFTYMLLSYTELLTDTNLLVVSILNGIVIGIIRILIWRFFGIPIISILISLFTLGFTIGAIIFYAYLGDVAIFDSDLNFWGIQIGVTVLVMTILLGFTHRANILACSILGSTVVIISIDYFLGSNLKYIFMNVLRRATVENFEYAVLSPPYQYRDALLSVIWIIMAILGLYLQSTVQRGRPPFPPNQRARASLMRTMERQIPNERTSLLESAADYPVNTSPSAPLFVY